MAIYLIKINVALMLLYGFYRLTVSRDTFFGLRRLTLWLIYAVALIVPAFNLEYWVRETPTMASIANVYADTFYPVAVVKAQAPGLTWMDVLQGIYWAGVAVLSLRMVWQLFSIIRLVVISRKQEVEGITVHLLKGEGSPFSFFRWIFMYPSTLDGKQLHEVMVHECTHVSGLHSLDTIFSELFSIACWFNPFAWLMKQEVRIKMMNKRRTSEIGKAKYLLFAPLAGALLMVSNIESVAREIGEQVPEVVEVQQKAEQALNADVAVANPMAKAEAKTSDATAQADTTKKKKSWDCIPETMPQFPGGLGVMMKYLAANIKYPASAVKAKKQGRVIVTFIVQKDGSVTHAKIAKSVDPELDAEALRIVKGMPKWTPGTQNGKPVNVKYTLPVNFSLQKNATSEKKK